mgnify:FL=1
MPDLSMEYFNELKRAQENSATSEDNNTPITVTRIFEENPTEFVRVPRTYEDVDPLAGDRVPRPKIVQGTEKTKDPLGDKQKNSASFAVRMADSNATINKIMESDFNPLNFYDAVAVDQGPMIPDFMENVLKSPQRQIFENAALNFVMAQLRDESGAAIGQGEIESAFNLYIPTFGNPPEVIAQKARARRLSVLGMKANAGNALNRIQKKLIEDKIYGKKLNIDGISVLKQKAKGNPNGPAAEWLRARGMLDD